MERIGEEVCFWCDKNIPKVINNYELCSNCNLLIKSGVFLIEVQKTQSQPGQPSFVTNPNFPTGKSRIATNEFLIQYFDVEFIKKANAKGFVFFTRNVFEKLGLREREIPDIVH